MNDTTSHPTTPYPPSPLCTRREAAALLHLSPRQLSNLVLGGQIPVARLGGVLRFRRADLEAFIETSTVRCTPVVDAFDDLDDFDDAGMDADAIFSEGGAH